MFLSKYLPVNIKRVNAAVYTQGGVFPADLLKKAAEALSSGNTTGGEVVVEDGTVTFAQNPEIRWSIPDIYLAHESLMTAQENNFSFYVVNDKQNVPQLFVSKEFKKHRLLVSALSFNTVIVTKPELVKRVSVMIDGHFDSAYCMNVFNMIEQIESGNPHYMEALIWGRDTEDECMIVNPITTLYAEDNNIYSKDVIEDYRTLLADPTADTEYVMVEKDMFARKNVTGYQPVSIPFAKSIVSLYDKILQKKNNYLCICGEDYETYYYVSTNWRYLVNAQTLECVVVLNTNIRKMLQSFVANGTNPVNELTLCWLVASKEPT